MKSLILIDLSAIFWAAWHATANESASSAFDLTLAKVRSLAESSALCVVCGDSPPYTRRKELLPTYKANREAAPPAAREQLRRVKARLEADGFLLWESPGFEADDVIATACAFARREEEPLEVTIASNDKDLAQLVDDDARISMLSISDGVRRRSQEVAEKFGVAPPLVRDYLALIGDKSDNVPGIPGVGPVNAVQLLRRFGDLEGVLAGAATIQQPKLRENLTNHAAAARLGFQLIGLATDVPIDFDAVFAERTPKPLAEPPSAAALDGEEEPPATPRPVPPIAITRPASEDMPPPAAESAPKPRVSNPTELVVAGPAPSYELALQPRSVSAAYALSKGLYNSRLYTKFNSEEAIMAVILRGREMGLPALTALDVFHVVEGKPTLSAHLIIDRARNHPDCEYFYFVGGDATYAEWECKNRRNPRPTKLRYTIEQAQQAGIVKPNGNWTKRPEEMLRKTCGVQLARIDFPGATLGLYAVEELSPDHAAVGAAA